MKKKIITVTVVVAVIIGLLCFYKFVPLWGTIVSTGAFIAGIAVGVFVKKWYDKNVNIY